MNTPRTLSRLLMAPLLFAALVASLVASVEAPAAAPPAAAQAPTSRSTPPQSATTAVSKEKAPVTQQSFEKVEKTDAEWKKILTSEQYKVLRQEGTERAFSGALWDEHRAGVYTCSACSAPLFRADDKFESGTGWPSFTRPIEDGRIGERIDKSFFSVRTEVHCERCGGHLGHVFPDGPAPTGQRYCMNSVSLAFEPAPEK